MTWADFRGNQFSVWQFISTVLTVLGVLYGTFKTRWELGIRSATRHLGDVCQDEDQMGCFVAAVPDWWRHIFWPIPARVALPEVPTISALIKAGDKGVFDCGMLDCIYDSNTSVSWKPIYEAYFRAKLWADHLKMEEPDFVMKSHATVAEKSSTLRYREQAERAAERAVWECKSAFEGKRCSSMAYLIAKRRRPSASHKAPTRPLRCPNPQSITSIDPHLLYYAWDRTPATWLDFGRRIVQKLRLSTESQDHLETGGPVQPCSPIIDPVLVQSAVPLPLLPSFPADPLKFDTWHPENSESSTLCDGEEAHEEEKPPHRVNLCHVTPKYKDGDTSPTLMQDLRRERYGTIAIIKGSPMIQVSEEELAALSLVLGIELEGQQNQYMPSGRGGFGYLLLADKRRAVTTFKIVDHRYENAALRPKCKNMHSTLMAKHLACGCIPFAQTEPGNIIHTLAVTPTVDRLIRAGKAICDELSDDWDWNHPAVQYLQRMPASGIMINYYSTQTPPPYEPFTDNAGTFWTRTSRAYWQSGDWWTAVAGIAFGGLVPMASQILVELVQFTVGEPVDSEDISALDALLQKTNERIEERTGATNLHLFGNKLQRHQLAADAGVSIDYSLSRASRDNPSEIMARMAELGTMLEALIAMVYLPRDIRRDCSDDFLALSKARRDAAFRACKANVRAAYLDAPPVPSAKLAVLLEPAFKDLHTTGYLRASSCGLVARCIIMAWTHYVRRITWRKDAFDVDECEHSDSPRHSHRPQKGTVASKRKPMTPYQPPLLHDLPDIAMWQ